MTATLVLETHFLGRILVVRPVGELIPKTYERLRDGLVEYAAEEPAAIVVDLSGMRAAIASLLTVFPTVRDRISDWPGVALILAAARPPLDFSAAPRFVPTYRSLSEALEDLNAAPPRRWRQTELPCDLGSARLAGQLVEQTCHEWGLPGMVAAAEVIASELTDNMVYHARSKGWLRLQLRSDVLTIAVAPMRTRAHLCCACPASAQPAAVAWYLSTSSAGDGERHPGVPTARWSGRPSPSPRGCGLAPIPVAHTRPPRRRQRGARQQTLELGSEPRPRR
jgi:hypothetical protein